MQRHCASRPGSTRDVKWGADECWCVGGRMFAVFLVKDGRAQCMSFKCDPGRFLELTDQPGIVPAPYLARAHWVQVSDAKALSLDEARELLDRSHALVSAKLTRRVRDQILGAATR